MDSYLLLHKLKSLNNVVGNIETGINNKQGVFNTI